jgi:hypothetical protein
MKKNIIWFLTILIGTSIGFFGIRACVNTTSSQKEAAAEARAERGASITPLTEKETELWAEVYAAAVRRGAWYPGEVANNAIIELRKMTGGAE